jgi:sugar/nucleoside kinase (ribokinase family)
VTLGDRGLVAMSGGETIELAALAVDVVEPSGAGDAFAAGLICGLLEGLGFCRSLELASVVGASACTRVGCTAGLVTRAEADAHLEGREPWPSPR